MARTPDRAEQERQKQEIIETATELILEHGLGGIGLADICKSVRMSKSALNYYYPSKDHILRDIQDKHFRGITDTIFEWIDSLEETAPVKEAVYGFMRMLMENERLIKLHAALIGEAATVADGIRERFFDKYKEWQVMVENGIMKTEYPASLPDNLPQLMLLLLDGMIAHRILGMDVMATQVLNALLP